jgi:hypothetical protein
MAIVANSAAATAGGGRLHNDRGHIAAVLQALHEAGALDDVLARQGLTVDDIPAELSPVGHMTPKTSS